MIVVIISNVINNNNNINRSIHLFIIYSFRFINNSYNYNYNNYILTIIYLNNIIYIINKKI